jgi:hypothetical protein
MRAQEASSASFPPPVGGWDTRNALADMPPENAVILDNWFPGTDLCTVRPGYTSHATGLGATVETVMAYTPLTGTAELFGAASGNIYDVSSSGAVGAAVVSGMTNARYQHTQVSNNAGHFLLAFNGADTGRLYNGTTWGTTSITGSGMTPANLIWCNLHQRRVWIGEKNSLRAWYLATDAISGTANSFDLGALARLGGYIMAMGTWTRDSGDGADDVAVFLTSEGEAIVYAGTDPSSASTWSLIGVFRVGKPIGRRCMIKAGADLIMVTEDGFVAASQILSMDRSQAELVALSAQINKATNDAVRDYGSNFGWQPFLYPRGTHLIFNIPVSGTQAHQYVFNTITRKPCRYTGIPAFCWELANDNAYFGGPSGVVYQFDNGNNDAGTDIASDALQAFNNFKTPGRTKAFKRVDLVMQSPSDPQAAVDINTDYEIRQPTGVPTAAASTAARWGIGKWGIGVWGSALQIWSGWRGVRGEGRAAGIRVRVNSSSSRPSWIATRWTYINGGQY